MNPRTSRTSIVKAAVRHVVMAAAIADLAGVARVEDAAVNVVAVDVARAGRRAVVSGQLSVVRNRLLSIVGEFVKTRGGQRCSPIFPSVIAKRNTECPVFFIASHTWSPKPFVMS